MSRFKTSLKESVKLSWRVYKWLALLSVLVYTPYIIYDDWPLLKHVVGIEGFITTFLLELLIFAVYFIAYSICYFAAMTLICCTVKYFWGGTGK